MARERKIQLDPPSSEPSVYEVGYRKPPPSSRFKPGQSGNPKGRPRGARSKRPLLNEERLKSIVIAEAYRTIKVNEGERQITLSMAEAIIRALAVNAARGQLRSQQAFTALLSETERCNKAMHDEWLKTAIDYKHEWELELARREKLGITGPEPIPHPDDIVIDIRTSQVIMKGPMTKEDKVQWDRLYARVEECDATTLMLMESLKGRKSKACREFIKDDILHEARIRKKIVDAIGEPKRRG